MHSEIDELKETETKLEELGIKISRKKYRNKTRGLKILIEKEIELEEKQKTEDKIKEYKIVIDIIISEAEDLINKLNEMKKIKTKNEEGKRGLL